MLWANAIKECQSQTTAMSTQEWTALMPLLAVLGVYGTWALLRAAHRESQLVDLGYSAYISDGLRAVGFFCACVAVSSVAAFLEPCLFLAEHPPLSIGLVYWASALVSVCLYAAWGVRRSQDRNAVISRSLKHNCANFLPPHAARVEKRLDTSESSSH